MNKATRKNIEYPEITKAKIQRKEDIEALHRSLEETEKQIKEKTEAVNNALISGDLDEYTKAQSELETAKTKAEFCRIKLKELETAPYFNKEERIAKTKEIKKDIKSLMDKEGKEAADHLRESYNILCGIIENIESANFRIRDLSKNTEKTPILIETWAVIAARNSIENLLNMAMFK